MQGTGGVPAGECRGRVALVTGASKGGTGTAIALRLAAEGAAVALVARDADGLAATAEQIRSSGGTAMVLRCDLSDPAGGRDQLVARAAAELGPVEILVNNAAANGYRPFEQWTDRQLEIAHQVNVRAPWQLMADAAPSMRARRGGWIVNITSFAAELPPGPPFPTNLVALEGSGYGVSKAALNRLTVSVAAELFGDGVAVNALAPQSAIATPHLVAQGHLDADHFEPLETMAEAVLALCAADPAVLTGRVARSLELLVELDRPVRTLDGGALVEGWQPAQLPAVIRRQAERLEKRGWPAPFRGHRR
jgi:NAD(P)-dependent dehydrogenase (short-subunit alcohol dehydrogenase family)